MSSTVKMLKDNQEIAELPIVQGTLGPEVIDIRTLNKSSDMFTLDPGFLSTASCESKITFIDGDKGLLYYRGYPMGPRGLAPESGPGPAMRGGPR